MSSMVYDARKKSGGVTFGLWLLCFVFLCGIHRFYIGRIGTGILMLLTFGGLGIWQLVDAFLIPKMVREYNLGIVDEINRIKVSQISEPSED